MKIAVVAPSPVPLRAGGAERLWSGLTDHLRGEGHDVELLKLPVRELRLTDLVDGYVQFERLDLTHVELVITGKYPAWMVDHPNHVVYMLHPLRGLYERYPAAHLADAIEPHGSDVDRLDQVLASGRRLRASDLAEALAPVAARLGADAPALQIPSPLARRVVLALDRAALDPRRVRRHLAISRTVARRPGYFPDDVDVTVRHPPSPFDPGPGGPLGRHVLSVGRLEVIKRHDLAIDAVRSLRPPVRLVVAGDGPEAATLADAAAGAPVELVGRADDERLAALYRDAFAVLVLPEDEDLGYVAVEAMRAARPVVTCTDSGGVTELVEPEVTGLVVPPRADAVGAAIVRLDADRPWAAALGVAGAERAASISWASVSSELLGTHPRARRRDPTSGVTVLSTYPVSGFRGGGARRVEGLIRALGRPTTVVSLSGTAERVREVEIAPEVTEIVVPLSERHRVAEAELRALTGGLSVTDMAATVLWEASAQLVSELRASLDGAAIAVLAQPYLQPALAALGPEVPFVYDAHNHEVALKDAILPAGEAGDWWRAIVRRVEAAAVGGAERVTAVSGEDLVALVGDESRGVVVPNGVDTTAVPFITAAERRRRRAVLVRRLGAPDAAGLALFVGSGHPPNIVAGRRLMAAAPDAPDLLWVLAGRHSEVLGSAPPNVRLVGQIDDAELLELLAAADVAVNPVEVGGGSNLKVLEAMAAGIPVVTTEVGARSIPNGLVEISPGAGITDAVRAVIGAPEAADERAVEARRWVETEHDWTVIGAKFNAVIAEVIER